MFKPNFSSVPLIAAASLAAMIAGAAEPRIVPTPRALAMPVTGTSRPALSLDLAARGYTDSEFMLKGMAQVYDWDASGHGAVSRGTPAPYATRLLVRRPVDARRFSGLVVLEVLDPDAVREAAPVWTAAQEELVRAGHVWVGLTVKSAAIEALKAADASRYGDLGFTSTQAADCHPAQRAESGLAWDVIAQAGAMLRSGSRENPLRDLEPRRIVVAGAAEAADYLVTFVNAAHAGLRLGDGAPVFNAYLAVGAGLIEVPINPCATPLAASDARRRIGPRDVPFIEVATGSELPRALHLRREDSDEPKDFFRRYEIAGASLTPPGTGEALCEEPAGELPLGWALDAIVANLAQLLLQGTAPPHAPLLSLDPNGLLARDGFGNAVGGLRLPQVQAPLASYAAQSTPRRADDATSAWRCSLTGTTRRFDSAEMKRLYGNRAEYLRRFNAAADQAVQERFLTAADSASLKASVARTAPNF